MEKKKVIKEAIIIFWIFIVGSILGYMFEMTIVLFQKGYFESRQGLLYGPFTPVYGIGGIIYYSVLNHIKVHNKVKVFLITAVLGGITEYICSVLQEKIFGTRSWDYSYLMFDINGRTSLLHCTYWGIAGVLYVAYLEEFFEKLKSKCDHKNFKVITIVIAVFMLLNISISCIASQRQFERRKNISPKNKIDVFLDTYYSDEYLDKIYANKKDA